MKTFSYINKPIKRIASGYYMLFKKLRNALNTSYRSWRRNHEKFNKYSTFAFEPKISIVMPTYNTNPWFLYRSIRSVLKQTYKNWDLCISDDASTKWLTKVVLKYYNRQSKIYVHFRKKNGHISAASNDAIFIANGEYIGFLDHDDELSRHALSEVINHINLHRKAKIFYSDEDKISLLGTRKQPHFKPDFNYEYLLSVNYICHFLVVETNLIKKVSGLRVGYEGAQDFDLLLRLMPLIKPNEIQHINKILYHWRMSKHSTSTSLENKDYSTKNGLKALNEYFNINNINAHATPGPNPTTYRVNYNLPDIQPLVSIIIPTRDNAEFLKRCINSVLRKTSYQNFEIIIINNQTIEQESIDLFEKLQQNESIRILSYDHPFNYSAINNFAMAHAKGNILCLLNDDTEVIAPEWLSVMVSYAINKRNGCIGAKLLYPNDTIQHAGVALGIGGVAGHVYLKYPRNHPGHYYRLKLTQNLSAVTGACLVIRKEVFIEARGLNEANLKVAFNDIDFCLKVRQLGYQNVWCPQALLYHHESLSRGYEDTPEKVKRFKQEVNYMKITWLSMLESDPYCSKQFLSYTGHC